MPRVKAQPLNPAFCRRSRPPAARGSCSSPDVCRPLFRDIHHCQIQHLQQAVIGGKNRLGLGHLAQLTIKSLDGVGGVNQSPDCLRNLEIGAQIRPIVLPGNRSFGVFLIPML